MAKKEDGTRYYPLIMYISGDEAKKHPTEEVKDKQGKYWTMRVIPEKALEPVLEEI